MNPAPFLLLGGNGQIGRALQRRGAADGLAIVAPRRHALDISNPEALVAAVRASQWQAVINCAAYTHVDEAETVPALAWSLNADAPYELARATADAGIPLIHVSSDYVFDGRKAAPYVEADPCNPLSVYGRSKLAGEDAVRAGNPNHAIIRTSWVVSDGDTNFVAAMIRAAARPVPVRVVADQRGTPTGADDIAAAICAMARRIKDKRGTWHFANSGEASWHQVAECVFAALKRLGRPVPPLSAISTSEYPTRARRPADSRLCVRKFDTDFDLPRRPWDEMVSQIVDHKLRQVRRNTQ